MERDGRRYGFRTRNAAPALLLVLAVLMFASCGAEDEVGRDPGPQDDIGAVNEQEDRESVGSEQGVSFGELSGDPERFYGERVTTSATVARVIGPNTFSLVSDEDREDEEPVEDEAVLVVDADGSTQDLSEEQPVRVEGQVRPFDLAEIEQDLGVELDDSLAASYEGRAAIVAESVSLLASGETTRAP